MSTTTAPTAEAAVPAAAAGEPPGKMARAGSPAPLAAGEPGDRGPRLEGPKRPVALLFGYNGTGFMGLQRQKLHPNTVEEALLDALLAAGGISAAMHEKPQQASFSRAARTDKGVHAVRQVVSLKAHLGPGMTVAGLNAHLPPTIRAFSITRTTKSFNCQTKCDYRNYEYVAPTYTFMPGGPAGVAPDPAYRMPAETHAQLNALLKQYEGTHAFHNFTSGKAAADPSAKRFLRRVAAGEPRVTPAGLEVVTIAITGQSFMIHQIRKMLGLAAAIMRGWAPAAALPRAFEPPRRAVPMLPGLGLYLDSICYDEHNRRAVAMGAPDTRLDWNVASDEVLRFKNEGIVDAIVATERDTGEIRRWIDTLARHDYEEILTEASYRRPGEPRSDGEEEDEEEEEEAAGETAAAEDTKP